MTIVRYNHANPVSMLRTQMGHLFNENHMGCTRDQEPSSVPVDIHETEGSILIHADMPGVDKKDVSIDLKEGILTISGSKKEDPGIKNEHYFKRERVSGSFKRAFTLTDRVNQDDIKASMENGVLTLEIPKNEKAKPRKIAVD